MYPIFCDTSCAPPHVVSLDVFIHLISVVPRRPEYFTFTMAASILGGGPTVRRLLRALPTYNRGGIQYGFELMVASLVKDSRFEYHKIAQLFEVT